MAMGPTIYRIPAGKSAPMHKPSDKTLRLWRKHRASRGQNTAPPKSKK